MIISEIAKITEEKLQSTEDHTLRSNLIKNLYQTNYLLCEIASKSSSDLYNEFLQKKILLRKYNIDDLLLVLKESKFNQFDHKRLLNLSIYQKKSDFVLYDYPLEYLKQTQQASNINYLKVYEWIISNLGHLIKDIIGCNFRIDNLWHYKTLNNGQPTYNLNSSLHVDSDFPGALKVLIYLSDVTEDNGPFAFLEHNNEKKLIWKVLGEKGSIVLFRANEVMHCATNTLNSERETLSFTLYPWLGKGCTAENLDIRPFNGLARKNPFISDINL